MRRTLLTLALFGVAAIGTPAHAQNAADAPASLPSLTLPPALDRVLRDYERAWRTDSKAVAALFAEQGYLLQSGHAPIRGREAIAAAYAGQTGGDLRLRAFAYAAGDTVGTILGGYRYGDGSGDMGKFTVTLRRDRGGAWQILSDMDNGNVSRRPAAASPAP